MTNQIIYAIIVTYNGMKWYEKCFQSLFKSSIIPHIVVIDNASTDGTVNYIRNHFPNIHLITSNENLGFAKANNIGIRYALDHHADFFFLLNQDAWVEATTIEQLITTFHENESVGIAAPMQLNGGYNNLDIRFNESLPRQLTSDLFLKKKKKYYDTDDVNAAAWMLSRNTIETIGGFDTQLFTHYGEDNNYCQRVLYHKKRIVINTSTTICHDRAHRDPDNDPNRKYWKKTIKNEEIAEQWSNINKLYNFKKIKFDLSTKILINLITFQFNQVKKLYSEKQILNQTIISRNNNQSVGTTWLG